MSKLLAKKSAQIALIGLLALLAVFPMIYNGVPGGNDLNQHFQFAEIIYRSVASGELYPSFAATTNQGYGDVGIRFYPPLVYYVLSLGKLLTGEWFGAAIFTYFLIFWLGGLGVFFWAKEEFSVEEALLAAGIFIFAPYHLNQIYNNSLVAEFAASAVLPFCFLFVTRVVRRGAATDVLGLAVSVALLLLTHLPTSIIAAAVLAICSICLLKKAYFLKSIFKLSIGVFAALAAASFYLVRMISEMNWVNHSAPAYFEKHLDYRENFLLLPSHVGSFQTNDSSLLLADIMLLTMLFLAVPTAILISKKSSERSRFTLSTGIVFLMSVLATTPLTSFFWNNISLLQKVQFPWRWLGLVSVTGAVFAARGIFRASEQMKRNNLIALVLSAALICASVASAVIVKQAFYIPRQEFNDKLKNVAFEASFDCWLPIWAKPQVSDSKEKVFVKNGTTEVVAWNPTEKMFTVSAGADKFARVTVFYYPHWQAQVNGSKVDVRQSDEGAILVPLSENDSEVTLKFVEPPIVKLSYIVSAAIWSIFAVVGIFLFARRFYKIQSSGVLKNL